jgi:hypothetical protein
MQKCLAGQAQGGGVRAVGDALEAAAEALWKDDAGLRLELLFVRPQYHAHTYSFSVLLSWGRDLGGVQAMPRLR